MVPTTAARAALVTMVSDALSGKPVPDFAAETLDASILRSADLQGQAVVVNFLASWCPVCQGETQDLRKLHAEWAGRGVKFIGVLVDPLETPDTVVAARQALAKDPLPYPVVLMNNALRDAFQYQGFPATYFIRSDGTFTTTLFGYHPLERLEAMAAQLQLGPPASAGAVSLGPRVTLRMSRLGSPGTRVRPGRWFQEMEAVAPFGRPLPIVLLMFEAAAVVWYRHNKSEDVGRLSRLLLWLAALSFVPTFYTGLRDVGTDLGPGWAFWNGLRDRIDHLFVLQSTISLHVILALVCSVITAARLVWRLRSGDRALEGGQGIAFIAAMAAGLWMLLGAGQVGGGLFHR